MSTVCTCQNAGKTTGFACNYSEGCPYVTEKGTLKERLCACGHPGPCNEPWCEHGRPKQTYDGVAKEAEKIKLEWDKPTETPISSMGKIPKVLEAGSFLSGTGVIIRTPNGDEFRFRYDKVSESIVINKISDSMRTGAITIQPGGGVNQIIIK